MAAHRPKIILEEIEYRPGPANLLSAFKNSPTSFLLDSACDHAKLGRFSFFGFDPFLVFKSKKNNITLEWSDGKSEIFKSDPFEALNDIFKRYDVVNENKDIPFVSGGVGYFAYDLKNFIEDLPEKAADDLGLPDCIFGFYDVVIIYDNLNEKAYVASSGFPYTDPVKNRQRAISRLNEFKDNAYLGSAKGNAYLENRDNYDTNTPLRQPALESNFSKTSYMKAVERAKFYIKKGDIYQVNLSQRFQAKLDVDPLDLYERLRVLSPAPFSSYLKFKDVTILSSSPERFLLKRGDYIETRPIKGTRPRGEDISYDLLMERELLESQKDRAEHVMIVDLERNDLGKICKYGSIAPKEFIILEKYSNVFHLVSTVAGRLKKNIGPIDCLLATFPGGSITGAPKVRAMEIIEALEPVKRSIYTGAIGYISFDGNMDTSIVIRTFVIKEQNVYFQVGGGIVADSVPEKEYEETLHKAKGLMRSLGVGISGISGSVSRGNKKESVPISLH